MQGKAQEEGRVDPREVGGEAGRHPGTEALAAQHEAGRGRRGIVGEERNGGSVASL